MFLRGALAALLALLLLAAMTVSVSELLHQSLHNRSTVNGHICLVCSFAKGQVEANEITSIPVVPVEGPTEYKLSAATCLPSDFSYLFSQSRAPPVC
jgi:hypothetical protein